MRGVSVLLCFRVKEGKTSANKQDIPEVERFRNSPRKRWNKGLTGRNFFFSGKEDEGIGEGEGEGGAVALSLQLKLSDNHRCLISWTHHCFGILA